jgi:hypothetical protein
MDASGIFVHTNTFHKAGRAKNMLEFYVGYASPGILHQNHIPGEEAWQNWKRYYDRQM